MRHGRSRTIPPRGLLFLLVTLGILIGLRNDAQGQSVPAAGEPSPATTNIPAPAAVPVDPSELEPVPVPQPSEKALEYYRGGMKLWAFGVLWGMLVPALIAFTGLSAALRNFVGGSHGSWAGTIVLYLILFLGLVFLIDLPLRYYSGFVRQHAYGLSNQTHAKWLTDSVLGFLVETVIAIPIALGVYRLMLRTPKRWWIYTAACSIPFLLLGVLIKPIWIDPLFNDFGPMKDKALEQSILDLASRAGIEGSRVFEVNKSIDTKAVNAYVTGVLNTKRIVLWDTLIDRLKEKEVLFVMAHEMGHYVLGHVIRSILLSAFVTFAGLFFIDRMGRWLIARFPDRLKMTSLADIASLPLLVLLLQVSTLALEPAAMAYSRYQEHEADRFALDLTRTNRSGAEAFVKLQQENLGNPRPGWVYRIFRASHPSIGDRIDFCNSYRYERSESP